MHVGQSRHEEFTSAIDLLHGRRKMNRLRRTQGSDPAITYDYGLVFDKPFTVHGNNGDVDNRDWFWLSM